MARQFNLGHDRDAAGGGVSDELARFVLCVEAAVWLAIALVWLGWNRRFRALAADFGQARILLDGQPPALIVGEMEMERVEFVECHGVDELLDKIQREHVTRDIEEQAAPAESRRVADADAGYQPSDIGLRRIRQDLRGKQLPQRLHRMVETGPPAGADDSALRRNIQRIRFDSHFMVGWSQQDGVRRVRQNIVVQRMRRQAEAGGGAQIIGQRFAKRALRGENARVSIQPEGAGLALQSLRLGEERDFWHGSSIL